MKRTNEAVSPDSISETELKHCLTTLKRLANSPRTCLGSGTPASHVADAAALLVRRIKAEKKREVRRRDNEVVQGSRIRSKRNEKEYGCYADSGIESTQKCIELLASPRVCYVCKRSYSRLHHFYDALCCDCGEFNFQKRWQTADLSGRTFLVTGGRIKIGFQTALKLLRCGADVAVTSRFPHDAAYRFGLEKDFEAWIGKLRIYAADFRFMPSVDRMCEQLRADYASIDGLVNNAAQTVRRPTRYYRHLVQRESELQRSLPHTILEAIAPLPSTETRRLALPGIETASRPAMADSALMTQIPIVPEDHRQDAHWFPAGQYDSDGQPIDARSSNSWTLSISSVSIEELLEVHAVNSLVPFLLIQRMEPLLAASPRPDRYIMNVSAMEGQLNTHFKSPRHPHTNMAKAGLNMVTRTCADDFAARGIYMNSVDTGWVTNEFPMPRTESMRVDGFEPPLDEIDGAARVLDPVVQGVLATASGVKRPICGKFLKDYREVAW